MLGLMTTWPSKTFISCTHIPRHTRRTSTLMVAGLRHVVIRYTPRVRALVVLMMCVGGNEAELPPLRHTGTFGVCISNVLMPDVLWPRMTRIEDRATEVDVTELLNYGASISLIRHLTRELARFLEEHTPSGDTYTLLDQALMRLHRAERVLERVIPIGCPTSLAQAWPAFPSWCRPSSPEIWVRGLHPGAVRHRTAAEVLARARELLNHELVAAVLATDTHVPHLGTWRQPIPRFNETLTGDIVLNLFQTPCFQGLVWVVRREIWDDAVQRSATAEELYDLGLVCCVQGVDLAGALTVTARIRADQVRKARHATHRLCVCWDVQW